MKQIDVAKLNIGYTTALDEQYVADVRAADTLEMLQAVTQKYFPLAWDAHQYVAAMDEAMFAVFRKALRHAKRVQSQTKSEMLGRVLLPETILRVSMVAAHFFAPWGCAFIRMNELGYLSVTDDGRVIVKKQNEDARIDGGLPT